ncbi:MAG TPA: hypothetical protein ENH88_07875 [Pseudoalteromonas prydzensis]|uniref:Uncharacterized protein n=1 Tax=Pseudoalteromonas prydzensis TaxID=182141 RepID=A0A7V1CXW7_9GAMM|nr:hypothetical protein [Pseudoalteromonas prydzensis]
MITYGIRKFIASFDFKEVLAKVIIDLTDGHFWNITAINCPLLSICSPAASCCWRFRVSVVANAALESR